MSLSRNGQWTQVKNVCIDDFIRGLTARPEKPNPLSGCPDLSLLKTQEPLSIDRCTEKDEGAQRNVAVRCGAHVLLLCPARNSITSITF